MVYLVLNKCEVRIGRNILNADFIILPMNEFYVILDMDWLSIHNVLLDCSRKRVLFATHDDCESEF